MRNANLGFSYWLLPLRHLEVRLLRAVEINANPVHWVVPLAKTKPEDVLVALQDIPRGTIQPNVRL